MQDLVRFTLVAVVLANGASAGGSASGSLQNGGYVTIPGGTGVTSVLGRTFGGDLLVATTLFDSKEVQVQMIAPGGQQIEVGSAPTSGNGQAIAFAGGNLFVANAGTNTLAAYEVQKNAGDTVTLLLADEAPSGGENPTSMVVRRVRPSGQSASSRASRTGARSAFGEGSIQLEVTNASSSDLSGSTYLDGNFVGTHTLHLDEKGNDQATLGFLAVLLVGGDRIDLAAKAGARSGASTVSAGIQSVLGVTFSGSNEIGVIKLDDSSPPELLQPPTPVGARPRKIRFAPEGDFVYVAVAKRTAQQPQLQDEIRAYRVSPDGKLTLENTISAGSFLTDIQVFPRGLAAATVSSNVRNEIRVYTRQGANLTLDRSLETSPAGQIPSFAQLSIARECGAVESTRIIVTEYQASRLGSLLHTPDQPAATPCVNLNQGRFEVRVDWSVPAENRSGVATATAITGDTGYFWFFDPANVELVVKVLDGRAINGNFWVYYGALTDVRYTITITDTETGEVRTYVNPAGNQASAADIDAFDGSASSALFDPASSSSRPRDRETSLSAARGALGPDAALDTADAGAPFGSFLDAGPDQESRWSEAASSATCTAGANALCLAQGRFEVRVDWSAPGQGGAGNAVPLSADTGYFWFFDAANVELIIKVLDARVINGKFWVYYGALSDVEYTITVTDTVTGAQKTYSNPNGNLGSGADTNAF